MLNITTVSYIITDKYIEVNDKQSVVLNLNIRMDTGEIYTPTVLKWQLSDEEGNVLNGRSFAIEQTVVDKIILGYHDTKIINEDDTYIDKKILSIATGILIDGIYIQENYEIQIKIREMVNNFPDIFETETGIDETFRDLDSPFTNLDATF